MATNHGATAQPVADNMFELSGKRVWVAGHRGMVGSALVRLLAEEGCTILTADRSSLDLTNQTAVYDWVADERPDVVFLAAAKVGGILANDAWPGSFLFDNLMIEANVIEAARRADVAKLVFLGSSCIYPKFAEQPIDEAALLTGPLEPTNEAYAIAKITGIKLCDAYRRQYGCDFVSAMPTNLYGPGDNYDLTSSHVIPALIRKAHEAKLNRNQTLQIWGTGSPRREFLYVDDCARALVHICRRFSKLGPINVGAGKDITILELAQRIARVVGFDGGIETDPSKPDGTPRKLLDVERITELGWAPQVSLDEGLVQAYRWFQAHGPERADFV